MMRSWIPRAPPRRCCAYSLWPVAVPVLSPCLLTALCLWSVVCAEDKLEERHKYCRSGCYSIRSDRFRFRSHPLTGQL
eukprot:7026409-Prymnesium_polylepis.2